MTELEIILSVGLFLVYLAGLDVYRDYDYYASWLNVLCWPFVVIGWHIVVGFGTVGLYLITAIVNVVDSMQDWFSHGRR